MQELVLNNELILSYPDGFHVMTEEERSKVNLLEDGKWIGLTDPDRHITVTAGWKQVPGLAAALLKSRDLAVNMEQQVRSPMKDMGYQLEGFTERIIAGTKANGFRYSYEVQQTGMCAESCVLKSKKTFYYLHFYARTALKEQSFPVWEEMLASIRAL